MSFENRVTGERKTIGYPVSGHPLDGMTEFIRAKSKNVSLIYEWLEKKHE